MSDTFSAGANEPSLVKYLKQLQYEMHTSARHDTHLLREALGQSILMKQRTAAQWSVHEGNVSMSLNICILLPTGRSGFRVLRENTEDLSVSNI